MRKMSIEISVTMPLSARIHFLYNNRWQPLKIIFGMLFEQKCYKNKDSKLYIILFSILCNFSPQSIPIVLIANGDK